MATIFRTCAMNLGMMVTYDEVRERLNVYTSSNNVLSTKIL